VIEEKREQIYKCDECGLEARGANDFISLVKTTDYGQHYSYANHVDFCSLECLRERLNDTEALNHFRLWNKNQDGGNNDD